MAKLKKLGFVETEKARIAKVMIGRIPLIKLAEFVALDFVRYIGPKAAN